MLSPPPFRSTARVRTAAPSRRAQLRLLGLFLAFVLVALGLYAPSFDGPFYADDLWNIRHNVGVHSLTPGALAGLLDPGGEAARLTQNWAPVHLFAHAVEWRFFGEDVAPYHLVNALVHAVTSFLLGLLLLRAGLPFLAAWMGAVFFLVHPANVEAVAWIYQLKTTLALGLTHVALLLLGPRPGFATAAFVVALTTKAIAALALPVAVVAGWAARESAPRWAWLGLWAALVVLFVVLSYPVLHSTNSQVPPLDPDLSVRLVTVLALGGRYLALAASGYGVAAFRDVPLAHSLFEPWAFLGLLGSLLVGARLAVCLVGRRLEAAFWAWAVVAFVPVCQLLVPFLHNMADRYLYPILPGLIGGCLLLGHEIAGRLTPGARLWVGRSSFALAAVLCVLLAHQTFLRAEVWSRPALLQAHTMYRYPEGHLALQHRAAEAAARGDVDAAVTALRSNMQRGDLAFQLLLQNPGLARIRREPAFQQLVQDMARRWLELEPRFWNPSQGELLNFADAHKILGDLEASEARLLRALERGGSLDALVRRDLEALRKEQ